MNFPYNCEETAEKGYYPIGGNRRYSYSVNESLFAAHDGTMDSALWLGQPRH